MQQAINGYLKRKNEEEQGIKDPDGPCAFILGK